MSKRDVLIVCAGTEGYGVRRGTLALATALGSAGFDIHFVAVTDGPVRQELVSLGHDVVALTSEKLAGLSGGVTRRTTQLLTQVRHILCIARGLDKVIQKTTPRAIYFRVPTLVSPIGLVARKHRIPAYWHMPNLIGSGYPWNFNRRLYWTILDRSPITPLGNSAYTAETLNRGGDHVPVLHVGTDETLFDPSKIDSPVRREELSIPQNAVVFGIVARLTESKGQLRFLESLCRHSKSASVPMHLVMVGGPVDSSYAAAIRELASSAGLERQVHLVGAVPDPERYYALMNVAVSSRLDAEPYGQSVVEAMMMNKPVLAHALGGPAETVLDGGTGWHVHSPTVESFAAGISRALRDRDRWQEMGQRARAHAVEHYSLKVQVRQFLDLAHL